MAQRNNSSLDTNLPYAEYWMGTHDTVPSYAIINNQKIKLKELI